MLRISEGSFSSIAREDMKKEILRLTEKRERVYLIVPEQKTVSAEKEMCEFLPPYASLTFEVTNFTRLSNSVFRSIGGIAGEYSDKAKDALIMWRTLTELSPFLSMTGGKKEINTGLVMKALSAVNEMKCISVLPEDIDEIGKAEKVQQNKHLSRKLNDISMIMTLYRKLLSEKYSNIGDDTEALVKVLAQKPEIFADAHFYIEGFTSFTEPQYKLLSLLMKTCIVTILLPMPKAGKEGFEFTEIRETEERLSAAANKAGAEKKLLRPDGRDRNTNPIIGEICSLLWKNFGDIGEASKSIGGSVRIFESSDPYEECEFVLSDIKARIMRSGSSYRDFAIVARKSEDYAGIIESEAENIGIPIFMSKTKDIFTFEAIKLIYTAYAIINSDFDRKNVIAYMKCGILGVDRGACDEFELYTEKWQINGKRFYDGLIWNMNPDGLSHIKGEDTDKKLLRIDGVRRKITEPLIKFKDDLREAKTVKDHANALLKFLLDINLEDEIERRAAELSALGESTFADEHRALWKIICDSLDTMVAALADMEIDIRGFENQLKIVHSLTGIGKIPAHYDEVTVGSADMLRLSEKKHIYLIGVNAGEFPLAAKSNSYFTDRDKLILSEFGLLPKEESAVAYARELFAFSRAFSAARCDVTLLYSLRDASFTNTAPADIIKRICDISCGAVKVKRISEIPLSEKIYSPISALDSAKESEAVRDALITSGYSDILSIAKKDIKNTELSLSADTISRAYSSDLALTQTRIDTYVSCPLSYYLKYNLKLSENEKARFDARNIGTFIHAILEDFFGEADKNGIKISDIDEKTRHGMVLASAKRYLSTVTDASMNTRRESIMLDRLCRAAMPIVNGLADEFSDCKFLPRFFELKIGNDDPSLPSPAEFKASDGSKVYVYGSIDRVDTYKGENGDVYVRVIDYKTGSKTFSPDDLDEGKNLQMFLYLRSVIESDNPDFLTRVGISGEEKLIPAGVIYVKADMNDTKIPHADKAAAEEAIKEKQERRGMILNEEESISAMNTAFIPVKFKKDGTPDARSAKFLYTREEWEGIMEKISNKVTEVADSMKSGNISAAKNEKNAPCEYCKFKPICRSANTK